MESQVETRASIQRDTAERAGLSPAKDRPICVRYGGHRFVTTTEMAGSFLRRAQQLLDDGGAELVPLLHREGVEMLYVAAETPFSVHDATDAADGA